MLSDREWNVISNILLELYRINDIGLLSQIIMQVTHLIIPYTRGYFIVIDDDNHIVENNSYFDGMDEEKVRRYINYYYKQDYLQYIYETTVETTVYKDSDILDDEKRKDTDFYRNFLDTENIPYGCGILIIMDGKLKCIYNLFKSYELGDFNEKNLYVLEILKKHIESIVSRIFSDKKNTSVNVSDEKMNMLGFTKKEKEITQLIFDGCTNTEIGEKLAVSLSTVKTHIYNIYTKANVKNRTQLINFISKMQ